MISTTKYRNKIYQIALERFKEQESRNTSPFLCRCLTWAVCQLEYNLENEAEKESIVSMNEAIQEPEPIWFFFPEIRKHKPPKIHIKTKDDNGYWFPKTIEGQQKRLAILEQAIQETNAN